MEHSGTTIFYGHRPMGWSPCSNRQVITDHLEQYSERYVGGPLGNRTLAAASRPGRTAIAVL